MPAAAARRPGRLGRLGHGGCGLPALALLAAAGAAAAKPLEVVIAHYREDLSWSDEYRDVRTVYCKSPDPATCSDDAIRLPNVGREGHTFLHHIVENYDNLADWTVFTQAEEPREGYTGKAGGHLLRGVLFSDYLTYPQTHDPAVDDPGALFFITSKMHLPGYGKSLRTIFRTAHLDKAPPRGDRGPFSKPPRCPSGEGGDKWLPYKGTSLHNFLSRRCSKHPGDLAKMGAALWHEYVRLPMPRNQIWHYAQGARFAASRDRIRERPKEHYAHLLEAMSREADPCLGYFVEYFWYYLIGQPSGGPCPLLPEDELMYVPEPVMGDLPCRKPDGPTREEVEIVVAQYHEDLSWLEECTNLATIYCKAENTSRCAPGAVHLENVGREGHTYLRHIVERYDSLANWTVFTQAEEPSEGYNGKQGGHLLTGATFADYINYPKMRGYDDDPDSFFLITTKFHIPGMGKSLRSSFRRGWNEPVYDMKKLPPKCPGADPKDHWMVWRETGLQKFLSGKCQVQAPVVPAVGLRFWSDHVQLPLPKHHVVHYAQGARFAASRARIRQRPKEQYEAMLKAVSEHKDPCGGYWLEWFWYYIIGRPSGNPCPTTLDDGRLKPLPPEMLPKTLKTEL